METVTLSSKFQLVIPKKARQNLNLKAGEKLAIIEKGNSIELVKIGTLKELRGMAAGISNKNVRDESERFD
ncbi:MAG: AbrB/MazE/SpoVT family DNA-binding domain-containing protein [Candidatus Diapherotrites archaeon]|nr:AbrB/MazE/SpoVT family DNA-binding domain-containing protein [Candidatus Diapherotrites archaeon]